MSRKVQLRMVNFKVAFLRDNGYSSRVGIEQILSLNVFVHLTGLYQPLFLFVSVGTVVRNDILLSLKQQTSCFR